MKLKNLRSLFYEFTTEHGFEKAVVTFNSKLRNRGYKSLTKSDWGKFLQNSPTRHARQAVKKLARIMPKMPRYEACCMKRSCHACMDSACEFRTQLAT